MRILKILLAGLAATAVMTGFMLLAPFVGLPEMNAGKLLGMIFGGNEALGWLVHALVGIAWVFPYAYIFNRWIPVEHKLLRGVIYGILIFVATEIIFTAMLAFGFFHWEQKESVGLMVFGNALACMIYGLVLGAFFPRDGVDGMEANKRLVD